MKTIWLTGLPCSGKSTIAEILQTEMCKQGMYNIILDGDELRAGVCNDLGFSLKDRTENIRRITAMAMLINGQNTTTIVAAVSPIRADRQRARALIGDANFLEVYVDCPVKVCAQRDVKDMYKKAHMGILKNFTGVNSMYQEPWAPDLHLRTDKISIMACVNQIMAKLRW